MNKKIDTGDKVNVFFVNSNAIFEATVLSIPGIVGDSYRLETKDGQIVYVQVFERMDLVKQLGQMNKKILLILMRLIEKLNARVEKTWQSLKNKHDRI